MTPCGWPGQRPAPDSPGSRRRCSRAPGSDSRRDTRRCRLRVRAPFRGLRAATRRRPPHPGANRRLDPARRYRRRDTTRPVQRTDPRTLPDGFSSIEAGLATLRAGIPWGDVGSGLHNAIRAEQLEPAESRWRPSICWALGMGRYYSGEYDEADRWFTEASDQAPEVPQWLVAASSLAYRSLIAGLRGEQSEQGRLAKSAIELAEAQSIDDDGEAYLALGQYLAARGDLDAARPEIERGLRVLRSFGQPLDLAHALILQASLLQALGEHAASTAAAAEAAARMDECPDPGILTQRLGALRRPTPGPAQKDVPLTARELAVLRLLASPLSEREIARELYVSHNTIHSHTKSIFHKLDVSARAGAVAKGRTLGLTGGRIPRLGDPPPEDPPLRRESPRSAQAQLE